VADTLTGLPLLLRFAEENFLHIVPECYRNAGVRVYVFSVFSSNAAILASHWHTVVLSVDRLMAIQYALRYHAIMTSRKLELMTLCA
jgi:hypothetical protein